MAGRSERPAVASPPRLLRALAKGLAYYADGTRLKGLDAGSRDCVLELTRRFAEACIACVALLAPLAGKHETAA